VLPWLCWDGSRTRPANDAIRLKGAMIQGRDYVVSTGVAVPTKATVGGRRVSTCSDHVGRRGFGCPGSPSGSD
jgi:hypothetical protein